MSRSRTGSRNRRASSGSRSARSSIDPLRSAKSTVTCLRSPSTALLEVRMRSARCLGVYVSGEAKLGEGAIGGGVGGAGGSGGAFAGAAIGWPQPPQNFSPGSFVNPHARQVAASVAPHWAQNRRPSRFSVAHCRHFIRTSSPAVCQDRPRGRQGSTNRGRRCTGRLALSSWSEPPCDVLGRSDRQRSNGEGRWRRAGGDETTAADKVEVGDVVASEVHVHDARAEVGAHAMRPDLVGGRRDAGGTDVRGTYRVE